SDVRAIVIAGVDVVDAPGDSLAKSDSRVAILRRAEHAGPSELQCAVPHAVYGTVAQGENASGGNVGYVRPPKLKPLRTIIINPLTMVSGRRSIVSPKLAEDSDPSSFPSAPLLVFTTWLPKWGK